MQSSKQRLALVSGANRGLGFAIAERLARTGLKAIIGARNREKGRETKKKISSARVVCPLHSSRRCRQNLNRRDYWQSNDTFRRLDVLVNNAGIMIDTESNIFELPSTLLQNTLGTNSFGPLLLSQEFVPIMNRNQYGRIVNISSTLGVLTEIANSESSYAELQSPAYRLSKTMLNGITALEAKELRGKNILVNAVCPGWVRTDLGGPQALVSPEEAAKLQSGWQPCRMMGRPADFFREHQPIPW